MTLGEILLANENTALKYFLPLPNDFDVMLDIEIFINWHRLPLQQLWLALFSRFLEDQTERYPCKALLVVLYKIAQAFVKEASPTLSVYLSHFPELRYPQRSLQCRWVESHSYNSEIQKIQGNSINSLHTVLCCKLLQELPKTSFQTSNL